MAQTPPLRVSLLHGEWAWIMLWQDSDFYSKPQPGEGTNLPSYWELHHQEIVVSAELVVGILLFAVVIRSWMYRVASGPVR
jgi:hypothetical protein